MLVSVLVALAASAPSAAPGFTPLPEAVVGDVRETQVAELIIRQRVIIRVPTQGPQPPKPVKRWKTKSGPKCIDGRGIGGAVVMAPDKVDLILPGGQRLRAELESRCPALDYYSGFYLRPDPSDGMICARRDTIHSRSGGECTIKRFRRVTPVR